jgi:hypothetical protein
MRTREFSRPENSGAWDSLPGSRKPPKHWLFSLSLYILLWRHALTRLYTPPLTLEKSNASNVRRGCEFSWSHGILWGKRGKKFGWEGWTQSKSKSEIPRRMVKTNPSVVNRAICVCLLEQ